MYLPDIHFVTFLYCAPDFIGRVYRKNVWFFRQMKDEKGTDRNRMVTKPGVEKTEKIYTIVYLK